MRQELRSPAPGDLVRVRGDCWRVLDLVVRSDCTVGRLAGVRISNRGVLRTLLLPFDRLVPVSRQAWPRRVGRRRFVRGLADLLATSPPIGGLRAASSARFDLLPYQLEPALACLDGETRLLLADEVGLGKTVQASLILAELFARNPEARCLVLAPASLCPQWTSELHERFGLPAVHVEAGRLRQLACDGTPGVSPWGQLPLAVASFDYVKQPEVCAGMDSPPWDALVVDEAHMAAIAPERSKAIAALARRSRRVVLLTATPQAGGVEGLRALGETGRLPGDPEIVLFQRTRAALGRPASRRVVVLRARLSTAERRLHAALERYTLAVWREALSRPAGRDARLAMIVLRKRAASGAAALAASLRRRLAWLAAERGDEGIQLQLPLDEPDADSADAEPDRVLAAPGMRDLGAERRRLAVLLDAARAAMADERKPLLLRRILARTREPLIVFTEYRDTLSRLDQVLRPMTTVTVLHGGLDLPEREANTRAFASGRARILLATDAAAQGLNLQARCRLVVNVELPWSPSRLEQRIGRVDRIGQQRRVHAIHLVADGTSELAVLRRLALRVAREREVLGGLANPLGPCGEAEIADAVFAARRGRLSLGDAGRPARGEPGVDRGIAFRVLDLRQRSVEETTRVQRLREMTRPDVRSGTRASTPADQWASLSPCWTVLRATRAVARLDRGVWFIVAARLVDGTGALAAQLPLAYHVELGDGVRGRAALQAAMPALVRACAARLREGATAAALARADELRPILARSLAGLSHREAAIAAETRTPGGPLQPGLFDRRALKRADLEEVRRDRDARVSADGLAALARATTLELAGDPELVLVLGVVV